MKQRIRRHRWTRSTPELRQRASLRIFRRAARYLGRLELCDEVHWGWPTGSIVRVALPRRYV